MTAALNTFVIIFRQGPYSFTDADKKQRTELTGAWAREHNARGHKLAPHILTGESVTRGTDAPHAADAWPVTALLLIEARDLEEATRVAEAHPALGYNANVEIRAWGTPAQIAS
ncbi:MAG: hypothetical protein ABI852_19425 [Gemmatimonadaceae bacterium]